VIGTGVSKVVDEKTTVANNTVIEVELLKSHICLVDLDEGSEEIRPKNWSVKERAIRLVKDLLQFVRNFCDITEWNGSFIGHNDNLSIPVTEIAIEYWDIL
jgi:hypothetical protein